MKICDDDYCILKKKLVHKKVKHKIKSEVYNVYMPGKTTYLIKIYS